MLQMTRAEATRMIVSTMATGRCCDAHDHRIALTKNMARAQARMARAYSYSSPIIRTHSCMLPSGPRSARPGASSDTSMETHMQRRQRPMVMKMAIG